jgi:glycosyltransferase involved in cell wall biosynthesis
LSKNSKYEILHPGTDWENIKPSWKYEKYFLVPGRIMWTKNIELAIESFKIFSKHQDDFKLIIAGMIDKKSTVYLNKLKSLAGRNENISFIKNPADRKMKNLYLNCYTSLTTSFNEDWGLTPIEANAYGKPVVAFDSGGFKESQVNGKTGYLIKGDPEKFASRLLVLARNTKLTRKMGKFARTHSKQFSWNEFAERWDRLLKFSMRGQGAPDS